MEGTPPQAQGRQPFMLQRRVGKSFILARSQEREPGRGTEAGPLIPEERRGRRWAHL